MKTSIIRCFRFFLARQIIEVSTVMVIFMKTAVSNWILRPESPMEFDNFYDL